MESYLTIQEIKNKVASKNFSYQEFLQHSLEVINAKNPDLNALISQYDLNEIPQPTGKGILDGIPCVVKDNFCLKEKKTTAGSKILQDFFPCYDATVVQTIKQAGGLILGKSNMDEFAMGGSGEFSAYGPSKNPWDLLRVPGGSSSGVASAVAGGLVPWGLGSETGGSVRQPASFCGLVGLYPTYGLLSRHGLIAFGSSLDQPGPITRTVYDSALVMSALAGHDPLDSTSLPEPKTDYTKKLDGKIPKSLEIGVIRDSFAEGVDPQIKSVVENSIKVLESLGAKIKTIDMPYLRYGNSVYFVSSRAEAASNLARIDGTLFGHRAKGDFDLSEMYEKTRGQGFGYEVKRRILLGNYVLSSNHRDVFEKALQVRRVISADFERAFDEVDVLFSPTTTMIAPYLGSMISDPLKLYMADFFTVANCVIGYPAISVSGGISKEGMPIGMQFLGPRLSEELLLLVAHAFEQNSGYYNLKPKNF